MPEPRKKPKSAETGDAGSLEAYRKKRSLTDSPEPAGEAGEAREAGPGTVGRPGRFVVQLHAARSRHFDLRLEFGGVLHSWAVPKGPSLDPAEKRFAVETEPHPLEYEDFEGVIPEGSYGAGAMIVWDRGVWVPHLDPVEGMVKGKQLFELKGHKLRGLWTLVRSKRGGPVSEEGRQWLLLKKPDGAATGEDASDLPPGSVLSGLSVEELAQGPGRVEELLEELAADAVPRGDLRLEDVSPMLAEIAEAPFSREGWLFELKYDGYRLLAATGRVAGETPSGAPVRLAYRSGRDATALFPELTRALAALPCPDLLLDGEVVVLEDDARPSFERLQRRAQRAPRPGTAEAVRVALADPVVLQVFDLLAVGGHDLRDLPLVRRKELLRRILPDAGPLRYTDHLEERGEDLYRAAAAQGLEGLLAKRVAAPYRSGRSDDWRKVRSTGSGDFVVVGWTLEKSGNEDLGALHLAVVGPWSEADAGGTASGKAPLRYVGRVGSGFSARTRSELLRRLADLAPAEPPPEPPAGSDSAPPRGDAHRWVEPSLVVEVRFTSVTSAGQLRHPVFLRLRDDKAPEECVAESTEPQEVHDEEPEAALPAALPSAGSAHQGGSRRPAPAGRASSGRRAGHGRQRAPLTNPGKVFWPEDGFTKGDLVAWYDGVADLLLPYLADRPVILDRFPDGIVGKSFFQKNAPEAAPDWVRIEEVWSESGTVTRHVVCDDRETLLWLANLGTIPLHVTASRIGDLQHADWCILDLDAKDAPFGAVVEVALAIRTLCTGAKLPACVKTSGATGLHVLIPLGGRLTHEQSRQLAEVLARLVAAKLPRKASVARRPEARPGKVYVDYLQNGAGKLLVAPYSVRPLPGAPVSMPLSWDEVGEGLDPKAYNLRTAPERLTAWRPGGGGEDPLRPILGDGPDLVEVLERLASLA